jgi:hypothetical protein
VLQAHALKRAVAEAEYRGLFDLMALTAVVDRNPGRRGATLMRAIDAHPQRTRSDLCSSPGTKPTSPGRRRS